MNDRITRHYNAFTRITAYGTSNAAAFGVKSALPGYFTELGALLKKMDDAKAGQLGGGADVTAGLLAAVQDDLQSIGRIARSLDDVHPRLKDKFPTVGTTEQSILTTADAYLKELEILPTDNAATKTAKTDLADVFIAHEMPETFVEDLRADRDAVKPAGDAAKNKGTEKVEDTAALDLFSHQGMRIRGRIVAALKAKYARQQDKLAAALSATHVERAPERTKPSAPQGATPAK